MRLDKSLDVEALPILALSVYKGPFPSLYLQKLGQQSIENAAKKFSNPERFFS